MSRLFAFEKEPYRSRLDVNVVELGEEGGRPFAVFDDTILFPEGGGQPADRGRLGEAVILDVQRVDGAIRHYLEAPLEPRLEPAPKTLELDWERRYDHMQQHTAQHLLTAVAADRFSWQTTSFHLQHETCDIELNTGSVTPAEFLRLEAAVNAEVRAARPIRTRRVEPEEVPELGVRSRGLPAGHRGSVRLVEIEGIDRNTCGGTHLASTAEIEAVKLLSVEPKRQGCMLRWIAGERIRRRLGSWEARGVRLRGLIGASDDELAEAIELKLGQLKTAARRYRVLERRLAEAVAEALIAQPDAVLEAHFEDSDAGLLQQIARRFTASQHSGLAFLTASGEKGSFFLIAAGGCCNVDLRSVGPGIAEILGGRGGGPGNLYQGKAESMTGRKTALTRLHESRG